ncbi:MAG: single-stranded DNA-binding protein [Verrucomicrobia bacterium]|nr:single-stranded DNA-binding protein [Verrucomicrobiota bacterium]
MASYNKVFLMGNLTRDPEKRVTPDNLTIVKLGLAVNRRYTSRDGEQREETTFVDIDAFGRQADVIAQYCTKGSGLFVEGRLRLDTWQDKTTGENRSKLGVVLENFQFVGGGSGGSRRRRQLFRG